MLVSDDEIVEQYEYEHGKIVIIDDKNFRYNIPMLTVKSIDIVDFIYTGQIDHIYRDNIYFI
ncbi:DNA repair protein [Thermoanaerobacterium thermosaccharolyticum]|uniref:DNA repair protein n=1 Tax=Thermoanaerobacterium thermosaccharolyticum TaxID=1517 RepID=A0A223I399_THETR|nr:DNA repair protein [Thermoanaerobacterium thermosaccharolyticum]